VSGPARLREARTLIERGWTQHAPARTAAGIPVWGGEKSAVCWCTVSALCQAHASFTVFREAIGISFDTGIAEWNDAPERTQAEVLVAFDKAIELAEQSA
jgi:hypothetical protein